MALWPNGLPSPACLFDRHRPNRREVKWDGQDYLGKCKYCGKPIRKHHHGRWQRDPKRGG